MISEEHWTKNRELHTDSGCYGAQGAKYALGISALMERYGIKSLLDYGCGKGELVDCLAAVKPKVKYQKFDPCVPEFSVPPESADMVACIHVLEHVEPEHLKDTIQYIGALAGKLLYFDVKDSTAKGPRFPDGTDSNTVKLTAREWYSILYNEFRSCKKYVINRQPFIKSGAVLRTPPPENEDVLGMVIKKC